MLNIFSKPAKKTPRKQTPTTTPEQKTLKLPNGEVVTYLLVQKQRKTVGLKINSNGLQVNAPKRMPLYQLEQVLQNKAQWIVRKLAEREESELPAITWQSGEYLLYLGQDIQLKLIESKRNQAPKLVGDVLELALTDQSPQVVQRKVIQWYQQQAMPDFERRLALYANQLGVDTPQLKLSNAKSRWGSCSSTGIIRLSWRLIQAPPEMINFVVCHELAHLKEMNHSSRFYAVLDGLFPKHREVEKAMRQLSPQLHRMH